MDWQWKFAKEYLIWAPFSIKRIIALSHILSHIGSCTMGASEAFTCQEALKEISTLNILLTTKIGRSNCPIFINRVPGFILLIYQIIFAWLKAEARFIAHSNPKDPFYRNLGVVQSHDRFLWGKFVQPKITVVIRWTIINRYLTGQIA